MFDTVLDAFAEATGCDRSALGALVGTVVVSERLGPGELVDRIVALERVAHALQAGQVRDLAAFGAARLAQDQAQGCPDHLQGRSAGVEVGAALGVAALTGQSRVFDATRAVEDHPELLALVGTGAVSPAGLRKVCDATGVLDPELRRLVDLGLAGDAVGSALTPGQLEKAAQRRVLEADPGAAAKRAAQARRRRSVWMGDPYEGTAGIFARLRAEEALAVFTRLDRTARGMRHHGDPRCLDTLMADLFTELLTGTAMTPPHTTTPDSTTDSTTHSTTQWTGAWTGGPAEAPAGAALVTWRSVDGCEPWLWSDPPPWPEPGDPDPDHPAWDTVCDPAGGAGPPDHAARDDDVEPCGVCPPAADSVPAVTRPPDGLADHLAHGPPNDMPAPDPQGAPAPQPAQRRLPMGVEVQVVIGAGTLLGLDDAPGLLRGYGAVAAEVVADIVAAAHGTGGRTTLRGLFADPVDGRLVAMDSAARCFTGGLRQFALHRDQDCRLTGGRILDLDHVHEHRHGGPTTAGNGQGLGKLAHLVKDHPAITVTTHQPPVRDDGLDHLRTHAPDIEWTMPTRHTYLRTPPPALGHGSRPTEAPPATASVGERHLAECLDRAA